MHIVDKNRVQDDPFEVLRAKEKGEGRETLKSRIKVITFLCGLKNLCEVIIFRDEVASNKMMNYFISITDV